jgi:hypothetical protein
MKRLTWHPTFTLVVLVGTGIGFLVVVEAGAAAGVVLLAVPALLGVAVAALVAGELRRGGLPSPSSTLGFVLVTALSAGAVTAAVGTWWALQQASVRGMWPAFDEAGIAIVAYCLFAAATGAAFGALTARVLPSTILTLAVFTGVRLVVALALRPRFLPPVLGPDDLAAGAAPPRDAWLQASTAAPIVDRAGHEVTRIAIACVGSGPCELNPQTIHQVGLLQGAWYQPGDRFWAFQGIEAAIFAGLAVGLALLAAWLLGRRPASRV